jgi:predicted dehydrogenase
MDKAKVAIIGFGKMGVLHGALVNATGLGEVVAIVDKDRRLLKALNELFRNKVRVTDNIEELRDIGVDVVFITTPIPSHYSIAMEILKLNAKGLFIEKTLTDSTDKSNKLLNTIGNGVIGVVGFQKRFIPTFRKLKDLIQNVSLNEIRSIRAYAYSEDFLGVRGAPGLLGPRGGVLRDLGSHAVDLLLWLLNAKDASIINMGIVRTEDAPCGEVQINALINGVDATISTSWCKEGFRVPEVGISVITDREEVFVNDYEIVIRRDNTVEKTYEAQLEEPVRYLLGAPEYYREDEAFLRSVVAGNTALDCASFRDGVLVDWFIDEALRVYNAHTSGR